MLPFLEAGLVAAGRQAVAVMTLTLAIFPLARHNAMFQGDSSGEVYLWVSQFLTWAYLLSAVGFILTKSRSVARTAAHIRRASRIVEPKGALRTLVVQLGLAVVAFTIFSLRPPPESLVEISRYVGCVSAASIVWTGTMSVGVAGFGSAAHAAFRAL
jgi:hypothetical protein